MESAHVLGRIGLAAIGGSCGLFVAEGLMRRGTELSVSGWIVILMMLYGAFSFYVGIDLPGRPVQKSTDDPVRDRLTLLVGCCWAIGSSIQIASGAIARNYRRAEIGSE
jgi:hypothetical protein